MIHRQQVNLNIDVCEKRKNSEPQSFFKRLRARLNRGDSWLTYDLANLAPGGEIDEDVLEELESLLVMADVGVDTTEQIIGDSAEKPRAQGT